MQPIGQLVSSNQGGGGNVAHLEMSDPHQTLCRNGKPNAVAFSGTASFPWQQGGTMQTPISEEACGSLVKNQTQAAVQSMSVRRLTPRECERLQGFPDDYTLIPWKGGRVMAEYPRGPVCKETPDGPRYKALGNSMAVPVMAWIGQRIAIVDAIPDADKAA